MAEKKLNDFPCRNALRFIGNDSREYDTLDELKEGEEEYDRRYSKKSFIKIFFKDN